MGVGVAPAVSLVKWGSQEYPLYCGGVRVWPLCMGPPLAGWLAQRLLILREEATVMIIVPKPPKAGGRC